jgi:IclR family transcriptional regulator, KDG regulon repressor
MRRSKSDYVIQTVTNALRLLEEFRYAEELGVTALARRLGLHKNNVFRLLATLEEMRFVEQCAENERYRLGTACLGLGQAFSRNCSLTRLGRSVLEKLARDTQETAHLAVLDGFEVVHLDGEGAGQLVGTRVRTGERLPVHASALGKAMLACGDPAEWERLDREFVRSELPAVTEATITDRDKFFEHLRGVVGSGFALDFEECALGLCCVAAPVRDVSSQVVAALSISAPVFRVGADEVHERLAPAVSAAAQELSRRLGAAA